MRSESYWELSAGIRTIYARYAANATVEASDILIVGAGFSGSWLAYFLKQKNPDLKITVVERDYFNLGASARNAGFLSCGNISEWLEDTKDMGWDEALATFQARLDGINTIVAELGDDVSTQNVGSIDFDDVTAEKLDLMDKFNSYLAAKGLAPFFKTTLLEVNGVEKSVFVNTFDSQVNPCDVLLALHKRLRAAGVVFLWQTNVETIGEGEARLLDANGKIYTCRYGHAFVCVNAFAKALYSETRVQAARGQILVTSPLKSATPQCLGFFHSGYDYFRFIGDRLLVGGGRLHYKEKENTNRIETSEGLKSYLTAFASRIAGHNNFSIDYHWAGIMGLRMGQHASIADLLKTGNIDKRTEEVSACGGWGVTLTPYVMKKLAQAWLSKR